MSSCEGHRSKEGYDRVFRTIALAQFSDGQVMVQSMASAALPLKDCDAVTSVMGNPVRQSDSAQSKTNITRGIHVKEKAILMVN